MKFRKLESKSIYLWLLSSVAFTIPLPMLFNNISIILLLSFWLFLCFRKQTNKPNLKTVLVLTIPYLLLVIGAFYSKNLHQVSIELTKGLPFLLLPIIVLTMPFNILKDDFRKVLKGFIFGNFLVCLFLLFIVLKTLVEENFSTKTLWGLTHQSLSSHVDLNAIYLSLYVSLCITFLLHFFLTYGKNLSIKCKTLFAFVSLLFLVLLIFLSSRTVMISCFIVNSAMYIHYELKKHNAVKVLVRFVLIIGFLFVGIFTVNPIFKWRVESVFDIQDNTISSNKEQGIKMRNKLWSSSVEIFKGNWLIGVGTGDFKDELEKVYKENNYRIQYRHHMNSHNQYLSYSVSNGMLGLLLFSLYILYCVTLFIKSKNKLPLFILLTILMCFMTESHLYTNKGVIVVAFFMTLLLKHTKDTEEIGLNEKG